jgi:hypothetical protein
MTKPPGPASEARPRLDPALLLAALPHAELPADCEAHPRPVSSCCCCPNRSLSASLQQRTEPCRTSTLLVLLLARSPSSKMLLRSKPASAAQPGGGEGGLRSITSAAGDSASDGSLPSALLRRGGVPRSPAMLPASESCRDVPSAAPPAAPSTDSRSSMKELDSDSTLLRLGFRSLILLRCESFVGVVTGSAKVIPAGPLSHAASPVAFGFARRLPASPCASSCCCCCWELLPSACGAEVGMPGELRLAELLLLQESPRCRLLSPPCCKLPSWK